MLMTTSWNINVVLADFRTSLTQLEEVTLESTSSFCLDGTLSVKVQFVQGAPSSLQRCTPALSPLPAPAVSTNATFATGSSSLSTGAIAGATRNTHSRT